MVVSTTNSSRRETEEQGEAGCYRPLHGGSGPARRASAKGPDLKTKWSKSEEFSEFPLQKVLLKNSRA